MRTREEVEQALRLFSEFRKSPRPKRLDHDSKMNMTGGEAAFEWFLGDEEGPVAHAIRELTRLGTN